MTQWLNITPAWVAKNFKHKKRLEAEHRRDKAKMQRLIRQVDRKRQQIEALGMVDEIWDGVPVWFTASEGYGKTRLHIYVVNGHRNALVYPNAHNQGETFGVQLHDTDRSWEYHREGPKSSGGLWMGSNFTEEEAHAIARRFITKGTYSKKPR